MLLPFLTWLFIGLCAYVYVGYPLLLALLARLRPHPPHKSDWEPTVSLIIAAYNEADVIADKLTNTRQLHYPAERLQVIVAADGSNDQTAALARQFEEVVVLDSPERRGKSAALNRAVEQATGEILVFSDANAFYDPDLLRHLVRNYADPKVGGVSGRKTVTQAGVGESEGIYWKYESFIRKKESLLHSATGTVGEINSVRRSLYRPIPPHIITDDAFLTMNTLRQGFRVLYEPAAFSWEAPAASSRDETIRRTRNSAGRYQLLFTPSLWASSPPLVLWMLFSHKFARLLLPLFMLGALLFNTAALLTHPSLLLWLAWIAQAAFYGLALLGWAGEKMNHRFKLAKVAYYLVSTNAASLGGLLRFLRGQHTVLWEKATRVQHKP